MGNAGGKQEHKTKQDLQATQLKSVALHEDGANIKFAFAPCFLAKEEQTLTGKSLVEEGRGGFVFVDSSNEPVIKVKAVGLKGRKATLLDGSNQSVAEIVIDHHFKTDAFRFFKSNPCFDGQASEQVDGASLFPFAKIETERTATGSTASYSVVSGPDAYLILYRAERVIAPSFMALVEASNPTVPVGKISPLRGPKLQLQVSQGVDMAAVMLVGEATSPTGGCLAALPGASLI